MENVGKTFMRWAYFAGLLIILGIPFHVFGLGLLGFVCNGLGLGLMLGLVIGINQVSIITTETKDMLDIIEERLYGKD